MAGCSSCSAWIGTGFGGRRTRGGSGEGADVHVPFNGNLEAWSTSLHDARIAPGCAHRAAAARWWPSDAPPSPLQHPLPSPSRTPSVVRILEPAATTTKEKGGGGDQGTSGGRIWSVGVGDTQGGRAAAVASWREWAAGENGREMK
jgi:hypothetical protein